MIIVTPMAGKGSRFVKEDYQTPKSLIPVSEKPMVLQATKSLPKSRKYHFVALEEIYLSNNLEETITNQFSNAKIACVSFSKSKIGAK